MNFTEFSQLLLGPMSGLAISLTFSWKLFQEFKSITQQLIASYRDNLEAHKMELDGCNNRYEAIFHELMKLKEAA